MSKEAKHITVVEDEPSMIFTLQDTLQNEGYSVTVAKNGNDAIDLIDDEKPDLMILDLMLPGKSGYEVCKTIRDQGLTFPVIMLTARDQEKDKVKGLDAGADDYVTKPFGVKELLARIQAQLRRSKQYSNTTALSEVTLGPVHIDLDNTTVTKPDEEDIQLSTREVELIRYLSANANEPVSRDDLLQEVWRYQFSTNTRTIDVHISKLRSKIEMQPDDPRYLVTLHGVGYMLKMN